MSDNSPIPRRLKWIDLLIDGLATIAGIILCALTLLICFDAFGRTIIRFSDGPGWGYTIPWAIDVEEYALYLVTFFGAPWVLREGGHIAIDLLVERLAPVPKRWILVATNIIGTVVCATLFYYSCQVWWTSFDEQVLIHETFVFPEWTLLSVAPATFLIMTIIMLRRARSPLVNSIRNRPKTGL